MSSPARSTVSAASGGAVSAAEDVADSIDALYRKDETMAGDTPLPCASVDRCLHAQATRETLGAGASIQENKELLGCRCLCLQEA
ncbi:hypothetical protein ZEAMMB73_Zm00001d014416 [Zea mays]|uniref:Uncharacterized protein n=1 Tax=Zea mays TaxID=4577 RepID=A0A1D6GT25_MAIZE|nr:hypothetical protein ZEAMMB73_Zm00001d014416 [Zea mays]